LIILYSTILYFKNILNFKINYFFSSTIIAPTPFSSLSLHDALPISLHLPATVQRGAVQNREACARWAQLSVGQSPAHRAAYVRRSEEHTSELQSPCNFVCRLLLEKKNIKKTSFIFITQS